MGLNLPEEQKVPLARNCLKSLEAPMDEGCVGGRRTWRIREIDGIEGVGAVRANIVAAWWTVVVD